MKDPRFDDTSEWARQQEPTAEDREAAQALARTIAYDPPDYERLTLPLESSRHQSRSWWNLFMAYLVDAIREEPARQRDWGDVLVAAVDAWNQRFPAITRRPEDEQQLLAAKEAWQAERDPFSVWSDRLNHLTAYQENWPSKVLSQLSLLLRVDRERGLRACEALPLPGITKSAFYWDYDVQQDRALIEELLLAAPLAFDADDAWTLDRHVAALLITDLVVSHAERLHAAVAGRIRNLKLAESCDEATLIAAEHSLLALAATELPEWLRRAYGILLGRPDGKTTALGYLAHLVTRVYGERAHQPETSTKWSAFESALDALCEVLVAAGVAVSDVRGAWTRAEAVAKEKDRDTNARRMVGRVDATKRGRHEGEGARKLHGQGMSYLLGAAQMLGDDPTPQDIGSIWSWLGQLLEQRDPGLELVNREGAVTSAAQRVGFLLARLPDPAPLFCTVYDRLEPQRRRAQHPSLYGYKDHDFESKFLVHIGLYAAERWSDQAKATDNSEAPRRLFYKIYANARRIWLTAATDFDNSKRDLVTLCFAFMPALFGADLGAALAKTIPPIANHPRMLADASCFLWRNGVEPARLALLVGDADGNLEEALHDLNQWADLVGGKRRAIEFPAHCEQLADALGMSFPHDQQAPEREQLAARWKDFLRTIPWGATLLRRVEEDGFSGLHLTPFDGRTTWLLQATAPDALRDRFGIAPQVRFLVVHGQVRGRDLRLAQQASRDAQEVDPDLLVVVSDWPVLHEKIRQLAGPWGQRIPWSPDAGSFFALAEALTEHLPRFDLFARRDPIRGRALIGRRDHIENIAERLLRGQAIAVLGLRKVGKSSLLQAVVDRIDPIGAQRGMFGLLDKPTPDVETEALVVSFDIQALVERTLPAVAEQLAKELRARLELDDVSVPEGEHARSRTAWDHLVQDAQDFAAGPVEPAGSTVEGMALLEQLLRTALEAQPRPIVFVLDEYDLLFEGYSGEPGIPEAHRLFALLRSLSQATGRVSLALIGRDPVFVQRPHLGGFTSPLLGWVEPRWLGPLRRDEADELLVRLGKRTCLDVGAATRETAWQWTGGHPLLLREYGSALFDLAHAPPSRPRTLETDILRDDAVDIFYGRDGVRTVCGEVRMLLEIRFPEALALLVALADSPQNKVREVVDRHGGLRGSSAMLLAGFGLLIVAGAHDLRLPRVFATYFRTPISHSLEQRGAE